MLTWTEDNSQRDGDVYPYNKTFDVKLFICKHVLVLNMFSTRWAEYTPFNATDFRAYQY